MNKYKYKKVSIFALLGSMTLTTICFGAWVFPSFNQRIDDIITKPTSPVCYIKDSNNKCVYYMTIEKALEIAGNKEHINSSETIYVIPGTNPIITKNCSIPSGDTLCLPYEDNGNDVHTFLYRNDTTSGATFADSNSTNVNKNRKNQITLLENVSLENNGTLTIGGSIGYGGSTLGVTGQTVSSYCEILMEKNSSIINKGNINLYGYIKEASKNNGSYINHKNASITKLPFVVYDFRGGSYSYACYKEDVMPFSNYDFPNCQCLQKYEYGSKMYGLATIYAGSSWSTPEILVLGTESDSCLFRLSNNYATLKYTPSNVLYTTNDVVSSTTLETANFTEIHTYGNIMLSNLLINLNVGIPITVNTSKMYCPLCFKYQVIVEKGTFTISNKMKFWGGSSLLIKAGATVTCNAYVSFYQNYIPNITTGGTNLYPSSFKSAKLVNNGILNLQSAFGGTILTSEITGRLNTSDAFSNSVTTIEILTSKNSSIFASKDQTDNKVQNALAYIGTSEKPSNPTTLVKSKFYESKGDYWYGTLMDIVELKISPNSGESSSGQPGTFTLKAEVSPSENSSTGITYSWSCDSGASLSSNSGDTVILTTPANTDENNDKDYNVYCTINYTNSDGSPGSKTATAKFTASKNSCFVKGTKIMMEDGSVKPIEDIGYGDTIMTWNFFKGCYEKQTVVFKIDHGKESYEVTTLDFSDETSLSIIGAHGLFDYDLNEFVYLNSDNFGKYIGHNFAKNEGNSTSLVKLIKGSVKTEITNAYSITSACNFNSIANGILTAPPPGEFYNWIEMGNKMMYDSKQFNEDVNKYGLYEYSVFEPYGISYEIFEAFNGKYLKIPVEKGVFTFEYIISLFNTYKEGF